MPDLANLKKHSNMSYLDARVVTYISLALMVLVTAQVKKGIVSTD